MFLVFTHSLTFSAFPLVFFSAQKYSFIFTQHFEVSFKLNFFLWLHAHCTDTHTHFRIMKQWFMYYAALVGYSICQRENEIIVLLGNIVHLVTFLFPVHVKIYDKTWLNWIECAAQIYTHTLSHTQWFNRKKLHNNISVALYHMRVIPSTFRLSSFSSRETLRWNRYKLLAFDSSGASLFSLLSCFFSLSLCRVIFLSLSLSVMYFTTVYFFYMHKIIRHKMGWYP